MSPLGIVLLDPAGRVISLNLAAKKLLAATNSTVFDVDGRWALPVESPGTVAELPRTHGLPPLRMWTTSLSNGKPETSHFVVTVSPASLDQESRREILRRRFEFTPAELRLAEQLMDGQNPARAALNLGVSIHTVRTYMKRLYRRTGERTQATLVRALLQALQD